MRNRRTKEFQINKYIFVFYISAYIGWLYETILTSIRWEEFADRGYLQLPLCPIYGFGAVVLLLMFGMMRNGTALFLAGTIITTLIELLASYILEYFFQLELWTYRHWSLNFQGRISFWSSVLFWSIDGSVNKADRTVNMQLFEKNGRDKQVLYQYFDDRKCIAGYLVVYEWDRMMNVA